IIIHEFCHSLVGRKYGLPISSIRLFIFGGIAEMRDEPPTPKSEFLMAAAGPLSSFVLAGIFAAITAWAKQAGGPIFLIAIFGYLATINLILAIFNLLPGFPLDGGRILRAALWARKKDLKAATRTASRFGSGLGIGLMV